MKNIFCCAVVLALAVFFSANVFGQAQFTTASVQGDVLDERGGSVPGASVEAKNLDEAIDIAGQIPSARKGTVEIRPLVELPGLPGE